MGFTTKALHFKTNHPDPYGAMRFPIYQNSAFEFEKAEDLEAVELPLSEPEKSYAFDV